MWESLLKSQLLKLNQPGLSVGQREKLRGEKDEIEDNVRNIERDYDARWGSKGHFHCYQCNTQCFVHDIVRVHVV